MECSVAACTVTHAISIGLWCHLVVDSLHSSVLTLQDQASKDKALQNMAALSSAQIVSPSMVKNPLPPLPPAPYQPTRVSVLPSTVTQSFILYYCI